MKLLDNIGYIPRFIIEALIIIPIAIIVNRASDGPYLSKCSITELLALYGMLLFVFRICFASVTWGVYSVVNILSPVLFLIGILVTMMFFSMVFHKDLIKQGDEGLSDYELAIDCDKAQWDLVIYYRKNDFDPKQQYHFIIEGNSESATKQKDELVRQYEELLNVKQGLIEPTFFNHFILIYLPRKYCQEKKYSLNRSSLGAYANPYTSPSAPK